MGNELKCFVLGAAFLGIPTVITLSLSKKDVPEEPVLSSPQLTPSDYARLTSTIETYRQENSSLGLRLSQVESQLQILLDQYAAVQHTPALPQPTREEAVPGSPFDPRNLEHLLTQHGVALNGLFLDILEAQKKLGIDPRLASATYARGMTFADLQRLQDQITGINHMAAPLGLTIDAQSALLQSYNNYQENFMQAYNLTPSKLKTLPQDNPSLYDQYYQGDLDTLLSWAQHSSLITSQQKESIVLYPSQHPDHIAQDKTEKKKKAQGN